MWSASGILEISDNLYFFRKKTIFHACWQDVWIRANCHICDIFWILPIFPYEIIRIGQFSSFCFLNSISFVHFEFKNTFLLLPLVKMILCLGILMLNFYVEWVCWCNQTICWCKQINLLMHVNTLLMQNAICAHEMNNLEILCCCTKIV